MQDPTIVWNIARKQSAFKVKRNGITRSQDLLNATGRFLRDDGLFAPEKSQPVSFVRGVVKDGDKRKNVLVICERRKNGTLIKTPSCKTNAKSKQKSVQKQTGKNRFIHYAALKAWKVVRSLGRIAAKKSEQSN